MLRLLKFYLWFSLQSLKLKIWLCHKLLKAEPFAGVMMTLAHFYTNIGKTLMMQTVAFAVENGKEIIQSTSDTSEQLDEEQSDESEVTDSVPPESQDATPAAPFHDSDGNAIPVSETELPEYAVFEALFNAKYGQHGRCTFTMHGNAYALPCQDLYSLMSKLRMDSNPGRRVLYGSLMSVIVDRHGHKFESKKVN